MSKLTISELEPPLRGPAHHHGSTHGHPGSGNLGGSSGNMGISGAGNAKLPVAISIKITPALLDHLRASFDAKSPPKLVVKNGIYSIKINDNLIFPCHSLPEHLNVDVYSLKDKKYNGRVQNKLTVITDEKKIKEYNKSLELKDVKEKAPYKSPSKSPQKAFSAKISSSSSSKPPSFSSSSRAAAYRIRPGDSPAQISFKLLHLLALGPITEPHLVSALAAENSPKVVALLHEYGQVYDRQNTFIQDDRFPVVERKRRRRIRRSTKGHTPETDVSDENDNDIDGMIIDSEYGDDDEDIINFSTPHYILKDKYYKELKPWDWPNYTSFERHLVIQNIHHALTRIGYSETHPLRRKICDQPDANSLSSDDEKKSTLGGGFLITSSKNSVNPPFRKSHTDSPKISHRPDNSRRADPVTTANSPAIDSYTSTGSFGKNLFASKKSADKRKFSSSSSSYSSDEEKNHKKLKVDSYTSPPSSDEVFEGDSSINSRTRPGTETSVPTPPDIKSASKRLEYYNSLAIKFKFKYKEYETLYHKLKNPSSIANKSENKRSLLKLFELHNTLSQWKRTLWDFDNEIKSKSKIMNLSKHKKSNGTPAVAPAPSKSGLSQSSSPAVASSRPASRLGVSPAMRPSKPKMSLDY